MSLIMFASFKLYFFILLMAVCYGGETTRGPKRTKSSAYSGLVPFFRTGRSGASWRVGLDDTYFKRTPSSGTLMAFPRVGRGGSVTSPRDEDWEEIQRRNGDDNNGANTGMWFGPRMGKLQKRQAYYQESPNGYLFYGDYAPRVGHELEESYDDLLEEQMNDKHTS